MTKVTPIRKGETKPTIWAGLTVTADVTDPDDAWHFISAELVFEGQEAASNLKIAFNPGEFGEGAVREFVLPSEQLNPLILCLEAVRDHREAASRVPGELQAAVKSQRSTAGRRPRASA